MSLESNFRYGNDPASEVEDVFTSPEQELSMHVEGQANYKGNWTQLLYERVCSSFVRQKFVDMKRNFPTIETRNSDDKKEALEKFVDIPKDVFDSMISNYIKNIDKVFNSTRYQTALDGGHQPQNLGKSTGYGDEGLVLKDANWEGLRLNNHQKGIIEAHEKIHGLFMNLTQGEKKFILSPFDLPQLTHKHRAKADEVLARMSQLKNYFGFKGSEYFTMEHLFYASKHYAEDVGMDNSVSNLIHSIRDPRVFIEVINAVPC